MSKSFHVRSCTWNILYLNNFLKNVSYRPLHVILCILLYKTVSTKATFLWCFLHALGKLDFFYLYSFISPRWRSNEESKWYIHLFDDNDLPAYPIAFRIFTRLQLPTLPLFIFFMHAYASHSLVFLSEGKTQRKVMNDEVQYSLSSSCTEYKRTTTNSQTLVTLKRNRLTKEKT